jgi:hypothetical protein
MSKAGEMRGSPSEIGVETMFRCLSLYAVSMAAALTLGDVRPSAAQNGPFSSLLGAWRGNGAITLEGGQSEQIRCTAYYTQRDGGGLGLAIRCASQSYNIELRSQLASEGGQVKGSWEERNFNAVGDVTGTASAGSLNLSIVGGGLAGSMSVATNGASQTVQIQTQGTRLQGVSIRLSKSG